MNEAVRNNPDKFPSGYLFELDRYEKDDLVKIFDRLSNLKYSAVSPTAFTECGLYMLATILKSARAVNTTLAIVDTFVRTRELARTMVQLQNVQDGGQQQRSLLHRTGTVLSEIVGRGTSVFYLSMYRMPSRWSISCWNITAVNPLTVSRTFSFPIEISDSVIISGIAVYSITIS